MTRLMELALPVFVVLLLASATFWIAQGVGYAIDGSMWITAHVVSPGMLGWMNGAALLVVGIVSAGLDDAARAGRKKETKDADA